MRAMHVVRRRPVAVFAVALSVAGLLSGCGFKGLYSASLPGGADVGDNPYSLKVEFSDVLDLVPQSSVKVNDVAVGKVTSISLGQSCAPAKSCPNKRAGRWVADVTVEVNKSVKLPTGSTAQILQTSLLGEKYVSLDAPAGRVTSGGAVRCPCLKNNDKIAISRSSSAPEAEDVLGALSLLLNKGGLTQIRAIAQELNNALSGSQRRDAIHDLFGRLNTFVSTLDQQKDGIIRALQDVDALAKTLNRNQKTITDALDTFPQALKVLRDQRKDLVKLLTSLAHLGTVATKVINSTQSQLVRSLNQLFPVVQALTKSGNDLPESLRILGTFPFPLGVSRQFVRGDYANLDAIVNLNLTDTLCGLLGLCANGASSGSKKIGLPVLGKILGGLPGGLLPSSKQSAALKPMLVGAGR